MIKRRFFATPQEAEQAFYSAFEHGDIDAMMAVWADDDDVVCIHPGGRRITGRSSVRRSWRDIFATEQKLAVKVEDNHVTYDKQLAIHMLKENIAIDGQLRGVLLATNIYRLVDGGWRMLLHHASADGESVPEADVVISETLH